jgi:hypothetical protein
MYFVTISVFSLYTVGCVTTTADIEEVNTTSRKLVLLWAYCLRLIQAAP